MYSLSISIAIIMLALSSITSSIACEVSITPTEKASVLLTKRDIDRLTRGDLIDAPLSTFRLNDDLHWVLPTAMQRNSAVYLSHTIVKGDNPKTGEMVGIYNQSKLFSNSPAATTPTRGYKWITNTYQDEHGILAFIHVEYGGENDYWGMPCMTTPDGGYKCAPGRSSIGLAWMDTTKPDSEHPKFTFLGSVASYASDQPHFNVAGTPWVITNQDGIDYINIYFSDKNGPGLPRHVAWARSPLKDVIHAAKEGKTSAWVKYDSGKWNNALTGTSSSVLPQVPELKGVAHAAAMGKVIVHSDIVQHTDTGRYFFSAYTLEYDGDPTSFVIYDSCTADNWKYNSIHNIRRDKTFKHGWSYLTFMDDDLTDNGIASGNFVLLSGYDYGGPERHVAKFEVSISDSCSCGVSKEK